MEDSPEKAGGAVATRTDPETSKQRNLDGIKPSATKPTALEPLPESVKAAHRRKLALAAEQAGAQTQPDRSTPEPASIELETISEREARMLVNRIRAHINDARALVLELYEREGWRPLGYNSWRECVVAEFDQSKSHLYRLLDAAKVEKNISPIGENPIAESVLRPLAALEPDQQREAWKAATEINPTPTAAQVKRIAESFDDRQGKLKARELAGGKPVSAPKLYYQEKEFYAAVNQRVYEFLEETIGPKLQEEQDQAKRIIEARNGIMNQKTYKKIWSCLHPDRVTDHGQKEMYTEAFRLFTVLEKRLLDEKDSPTQFVNIPKTAAEWEEPKCKATIARKTARPGDRIETTKAFERAVSLFYPEGHAPEEFANDLCGLIDPELFRGKYTEQYLRECIRVFQLVVKGLL